jgi:hypothetical protein
VTAAFLDTFERIAPQLEYYPQWARVFFLITLVLVAVAVLVFVILFPPARRTVRGQRT